MTSSSLASALPRSWASSTDSICAVFQSGASSGSTCQRRNVSIVARIRCRPPRARRCPRCTSSWSPRRAPSRARRTRCRAARSSRAPARPPAAVFPGSFLPLQSLQFRHQLGPLHSSSSSATSLSIHLELPPRPFSPRSTPAKRLRPARIRRAHPHFRLLPAKRAKSAPLRSGRSSPGEDTSSRS